MKARRVKHLEPTATLADNAERLVRVRLDELCGFVPAVLDPAQVTELHDMRIAAKRLRYVLEVTSAPCFGPYAKTAGKRAKELQDLLGEIHDCDIQLPRVEALLGLRVAMSDVVNGERGLTNPLMATPEPRKAQWAYLDQAWTDADEAYAQYEKIPRPSAEDQAGEDGIKRFYDEKVDAVRRFHEADVKLIACQMTMDLFEYKMDDMIEGPALGGAASYIEVATKSDINLYI